MQVQSFPDYDAMSRAVADLVLRQIAKKPDSLLCFPSGDSPTGTLKCLVEYASSGLPDMSRCRFVGLDEWVGLNGRDEGSCRYYLDHQLFHPLGIKEEKILFFDGRAENLDKECARVDEWLRRNGSLDIMLVGIGMNGHIGLNEPGADFNGYSRHSALDPLTGKVARKYFTKETQLKGGITLGLRYFAEARLPLLIASGKKKAPVVARALEGPLTPQFPASILQTLPKALVCLDREAASELTRSGTTNA